MKLRFLLPALMLLAGLASASTADRAKPRHKAPSEKQAEPVPPAVPLVPNQMPATPPQVGFEQGQLTINAPNSTLGDILRAVRMQTGATVDVPGNATERVVGKFGPGPARDVLTALLNGSHFNYVLLGSATDSAALDRVILISRTPVTAEEQPNIFAQQARPGQPQPGVASEQDQDMQVDDAAEQDAQAADSVVDDQGQPQADEAQQQPPQPAPFGQPGVRTPEQLLQELQQRQQQGLPTPGVPGMPGPNGQIVPH